MLRTTAVVLLALMSFATAADANPTKKLWIAVKSDHGNCKQKVDDFSSCLLDATNFRPAFLASYPSGEDVVLGGTKTIGNNCGLYDYQCVVDQAGFAVQDDDILLYVGGGSNCSGGENQRGYTVTINNKVIHPRTAWTDAFNCDCVTPFIQHEVYEAANDQDSADCCNGQNGGNGYGYPFNAACGQKFGAGGSVAPYGWYWGQCPSGMFRFHYLAPYPKKGDPNACTKLQAGCPMGGTGKVLHAGCMNASECCMGFACENWVYNPKTDPIQSVCCVGVGGSCSVGTDCCGGSDCDMGTHKCSCVPKDGWCINKNECCDGFTCDTTAQKCVPAPPMDAGSDASADAGAMDGSASPLPEAGDAEIDPAMMSGGCACDAVSTAGGARARSDGWTLALGAAALVASRRRRRER